VRNVLNGLDIVVREIKQFEIGEIIKTLNFEDTIVIEFKFNKIGTKIKPNNFLDKIVSQIESLDVGRVYSMLFNGPNSATNVIDFL
jgi:hypothetical protein